MRRLSEVAVAASLLVALGACGEAAPPPADPPSLSSPLSSAPSPSPESASSVPTSEPLLRLRGTVSPGVEANCLVLNTKEGQYLLLGGVAVPEGVEVIVEGRTRPDLMSYCQQGIPFTVSKVEPV